MHTPGPGDLTDRDGLRAGMQGPGAWAVKAQQVHPGGVQRQPLLRAGVADQHALAPSQRAQGGDSALVQGGLRHLQAQPVALLHQLPHHAGCRWPRAAPHHVGHGLGRHAGRQGGTGAHLGLLSQQPGLSQAGHGAPVQARCTTGQPPHIAG